MSAFFSVVIPVYDRANVLQIALRSVLAQTEQDFDIVVVDDGSHDHPEDVVQSMGDPRIRFVRQVNQGAGAARNAGIDLAQGRFIALLDSDDTFLPHHLSSMRRLLEGTDKLVAYAPIIVDRGNGVRFIKPPRALGQGEHMANYLLCDRGFVPTTTLALPRDLAARIRYDETLPCAQDTDFALRLSLAGCGFVMAHDPGGVWHDERNALRVSAGRKMVRLERWLDDLRPRIPARAYHGARGWMIAKGVVRKDAWTAFQLWLDAVLRGAYRPRLAALILLQIFVPDPLYRRLADWMISRFRGRVWSKRDRAIPAAR